MGQYDNDAAGIYLVEVAKDVATLQLKNPNECYYVTQATLSVDDTSEIIAALRVRFPAIKETKKRRYLLRNNEPTRCCKIAGTTV